MTGQEDMRLLTWTEDLVGRVHQHLETIASGCHTGGEPWPDEQWKNLVFTIRDDLVQLLNRQSAEGAREGGPFAAGLCQTALYALVAWTDEMFLSREWPGRALWEDQILERHFFQTHQAGTKIFEQMETLLAQGRRAQPELLRLYLWILCLGFRGQFAEESSGPESPLQSFRYRLAGVLNDQVPDDAPGPTLFPETGQHVFDRGERVLLPDPGLWTLVYGAFLGILFVAGTWGWLVVTRPLRLSLEPVLQMMEGL
jgi:type IV/VI secretion system ImpK/VasF family protein